MEEARPMDRLICGDVGYGKTEVALRAAFKAAEDGKQVMFLVPTTVLAQQHFGTFTERLRDYPFQIDMVSRFRSPKEARDAAAAFERGEVDILIGTHRLLSRDVRPKDLGLLIVDEEQRFGVKQKELLRQLKLRVDVLSLSATPIPRTLQMSLAGLRDISVIETPPEGRRPVKTYVGEYDEELVASAIKRELAREGQTFFLHNRVDTIDETAERIRAMVPEARVSVAHGQMAEGQLEDHMLEFLRGDADVLVCTSIVESGLDIPTANTLIVERADLFGLAQLYQIRGRVGRSRERAYAYLLYPSHAALSEEASKRLATLSDYTELGSGFKIAMRDLEIRGAGNLLGTGQSGHIAAVGYDLYCQMVSEAVAELKGEPVKEPAEIKLDLPLAANLPREYVQKEELRLEAYRRLASVTTDDEVQDIRAEWEDRYGPLPPPAEALLAVARLRAEASRTGVREVTVVKPSSFGGAPSTARVSPIVLKTSQQIRLKRLHPTAVYKEGEQLLIVKVPHKDHPADWLVDLLRDLEPVSEPQPA
jgi:transcription-repair coupling factor (superfamily II helicase)